MFFLFIGFYKIIPQKNYLLVALVATVMIILLDYYLIDGHPSLFYTNDINNEVEDALYKLIDTESEDMSYYYE